ncbi:hypothetical protein [Maribellus mangrovi]|uniref:hypothetical protein n=1 Tax=Maribellus mangrovi TaxID=3133146 RepID=UPI0030ECBE11
MTEEPVEIDLRLIQDVDTEGKKATEGINDVSEASEKMKAETQKAMEAQKKVIASLTTEINNLKKELAKPVKTNDAALIQDKEKLTQTVAQLEKKLKDAEAAYTALAAKGKTTTTTTQGIGSSTVKAAKGMNQLGYSVQQVARELPSLYISPQMFFLAISNNLPILQDQLRRTRLENEALKASGQSTVPVWRQVAKSIFSWQTALIAGITLLTVFGKDIFAAIGNMTQFGDAARLTRKELKEMTAELSKNMGTELGQMDLLFSKLESAKKGTNEYYSSKREIIKQYGNYLQGLDNEITALNDVAGAYKIVRSEIIKTAKEKALKNVFEEQQTQFTDTYLTQLPKIRELLVDQYGDIMGNQYADLIDEQLQQGKEFSYDVQRVIDSFTKTGFQTFTSTSGATQTVEYEYNNLREAIEKVTDAQSTFEGKVADAKKSLNYVYKTESKEVNSLIQDQRDLIEQYKLMPEATEGQIKAKNKLIEAAEEEIKRLQELGRTNKKEQKKEETEKGNAKTDLAEISVKTQEEIDADTIAAMQDGAAKRIAEVELEYTKRKNTIAAKLKEIEELEKKTGAPATGQRQLLANLLEASTAQYEASKQAIEAEAQAEIDGVFADVNQRFTSQLQNQLNRVKTYYDEQLKIVQDNTTSRKQLEDLQAELEEKRLKELAIVREEHNLRTLEFEEQIALKRQENANEELAWEADKQKKLLEVQLQYATRRLNALNNIKINGGDAEEEIARLRAEIERLNKELGKTDSSKLREITDVLRNSLDSIASSLSKIPGTLGKIGEAMYGIADNANNIGTILDKNSSKTDIISAGVDGLANLFGMVAGQIAENKKMQEEWNEKIREAAHQAALARIELQAYQEGNIFGIENPYAKAIAGANEYSAAMQELQQSAAILAQGQVQVGTTKKVSGKNVATGLASGAAAGAAVGTIVPVIGTAVGAVVGGIIGGIAGLFSKKTVPVFESLAKKYGEIYDKETFELNPEILADYEKLDDATKKLVDNWEEIRTKAEEAQQQMRDTFKSLAGDIGTQLSDALVNAFRNNALTSAMNDFESGVSSMIENIIAQMVFATYFQSMLDELQQGFEDSFKDGGDQDIIDDIIKFTQEYTDAIPGYMDAMKTWREEMKRQGFDVFEADTRTPSSKGIAQASQDSVDELNGRITNIQQMIYDIRGNGQQGLNQNAEFINHQKAIRNQLDRIAENSEFLRKLERIDTSLDNMNLRGVKIKQ